MNGAVERVEPCCEGCQVDNRPPARFKLCGRTSPRLAISLLLICLPPSGNTAGLWPDPIQGPLFGTDKPKLDYPFLVA